MQLQALLIIINEGDLNRLITGTGICKIEFMLVWKCLKGRVPININKEVPF